MRMLVIAAGIVGGVLGVASQAGAVECYGVGHRGTFGTNMSGHFSIESGTSCSYGFFIQGEVYHAGILQKAQHGTVKMLNKTTVEYRSNAGYKGVDRFKVVANGKSIRSRGNSILSLTVDVE